MRRYLAAAAMVLAASSTAQAQETKVFVTGIVDHPVIDAIREGIEEALAARGYKAGETIEYRYQSAQGNVGIAAQIARDFVSEEPAVIIPISTPSAQAMVQAAEGRIPVVFASVTDPVGAGLVVDPAHPEANVTGVSDLVDPLFHLQFLKEVLPAATRVGIITNPGEANSVTLLTLARAAASELGLELVERVATRSAEVPTAAQSLVGEVDATYMPADNTAASALAALIQIAEDNDLPLIAPDNVSVETGALGTVGFDYRDVGRLAGGIAADIIEGKAPGDIPVVYLTEFNVIINPTAAEAMGVTVPPELLARASLVGAAP